MRNKIILSFILSLVLGACFFYRTKVTILNLTCNQGVPVDLEYEYGRFGSSAEKYRLLPAGSSVTNLQDSPTPYVDHYAAIKKYPDGSELLWTVQLAKINILKSISFDCEGLREAFLVYRDGTPRKEIPITPPKTTLSPEDYTDVPVSLDYWFLGFILFTIMIFVLTQEFDKFRKNQNKTERIITASIFFFIVFAILYFFPAYVSPFNPTTVLWNAQADRLEGWQGILFSVLVNAILEFIPKVPAVAIPFGVVIFCFLNQFVSLGRNTKQKILLLAALAVCFSLSPVLFKFTQYFERANFVSWCFVLLAVRTFRYHVFPDERNKYDLYILLLGFFLLSLLRTEYILVVIPFIYSLFSGNMRKLSAVLVFVLSFFIVNTGLDSFDDANGKDWKFRYYVVSLGGYVHKLAAVYPITLEEKETLSYYYNMDLILDINAIWLATHNFPPGKILDLKKITDIIWTHFKQDPLPILISRAGYAIISLGMINSSPPGLYTPLTREHFESDLHYFNTLMIGSKKVPGDPFYSSSESIYRNAPLKSMHILSYGIIFIFIGLFLFRKIPTTSLICLVVLIKLGIVVLVAPVRSFVYVLDAHLMCALIVFLARIEWKVQSSKFQNR